MILETRCKDGKLQVDETTIRVVAPFKKTLWEIPRSSIRKIVRQSAGLTTNVMLLTDGGTHLIEMVSGKIAKELIALHPDVEWLALPMVYKWYVDMSLVSYIATYTKEADANREVAEAAKYGWHVDDLSSTAGHVNVGRTATAAVLTGGVSLLLGASRSKDKLTIAFARESDWLERYKG